jgi:hypothetical protein
MAIFDDFRPKCSHIFIKVLSFCCPITNFVLSVKDVFADVPAFQQLFKTLSCVKEGRGTAINAR